jgi:hypothetical protein
MPLSDDEIKRILLEEEHRNIIRRQFEDAAEEKREKKEAEEAKKKNTPRAKLWAFLNSSFGLLLFGSVILASLGEGWRAWLATREEIRQAEKIFIEVSHRVSRVRDEAVRFSAEDPKESHRKDVLILLRMDHSRSTLAGKEEVYAFSEYKTWSLQNLLYQLQMIGNEDHAKRADRIGLLLSNVTYEVNTNGVTRHAISQFNQVIKECKLK